MFSFLKPERGFTLIEMLIVVAIIGMLSSFVGYSFSKSRPKARLAVVQQQLGSLHPYLIMCINDGQTVDWTDVSGIVVDTTKICAHANEVAVFPELSSHWSYQNASGLNKFKAKSDEGDLWEIECSETGCLTITPPAS